MRFFALRKSGSSEWIRHFDRTKNRLVEIQLCTNLEPHICTSVDETIGGISRIEDAQPYWGIAVYEVELYADKVRKKYLVAPETYFASLMQ